MLLNVRTFNILFRSLMFVSLMIAGAIADAENLPSNNPDDYEVEKYYQYFQQADANYRQAAEELRQAEEALATAVRNENAINDQYRRTVEDFNQQRRHLEEIRMQIDRLEQDRKTKSDNIDRAAAQVEQTARHLEEARASVGRFKQISDSLKSTYDSAANEMRALQGVVDQKQRDFSTADSALAAQAQAVERLQRAYETAPPERKEAVKAELDVENAKIPAMLTARSNADAGLKAAQASVAAKKPALDAAKSNFDASMTEFTNAQNRVKEMETEVAHQTAEIARARQELAGIGQQQANLNQEFNRTRDYVQNLKDRTIPNLEQQIRYAQSETQQRTYTRDSELAALGKYGQARQGALARYDQVRQILATAISTITATATAHATADGTQEGIDVGTSDGTRDGIEAGQRLGTIQGEKDGRLRDYNEGRDKGVIDAEQEALSPRKINVPASGDAYNFGRQKGYEFGYRTRNNKASYDAGRTVGEAEGLEQAVKEAAPENQKSYDLQEKYYRNLPLNKVNLGEATIATKFNGTQGRYSQHGDDHLYHPRPDSYPHPRLLPVYQTTYDNVYRQRLDDQYGVTYWQVEKAVEKVNFDEAQARAYAKKYEDSRLLGFNQAYLGFTNGNSEGSKQVGHDEGKFEKHRDSLAGEIAKAQAAGKLRCDELYLKHDVIAIESVGMKMLDQDRDGIVRPGETLQLVFVVKNFGFVAKPDLQVEASSSGASSVLIASTTSPAIPPQSEATVTGLQQVQTDAKAEEGAALAVSYRLRDGKQTHAQQTFNAVAQFPTVTKLTDFDGTVIPGENTQVKVALTNRSKSIQSLIVKMKVDATKVNLAQQQIAVDKLAPGESKTVAFTMSGKAEARFEESSIQTTVLQNNLLFGHAEQKITIIKRHAPTADSLGLIISRNLALGAGKHLYALDKYDTWDLRVDGVISSQLNNYTGKSVHIMADAGAAMDAASAKAIQTFATNGGQVVIWGGQLDQSGIMNQFAALAMVQVARSSNINDSLGGTEAMSGFEASAYSGAANILTVTGVKSRYAVVGNTGAVGTQSVINATVRNAQVGRIYTIGLDAQHVDAHFLSNLNYYITYMAMPFDQKLESATKDPSWMNMLLMDIQEELMFSANESPDRFLNDRHDNKMYKALERIVGDNVNAQTKNGFAQGYQLIMDTAQRLGNISNAVWNVMDLESAGGFWSGRTWKSLFCEIRENQYNSPYCKNDNNNGG